MFLNFKSYRTSKGKLLRMLRPMRKEHFAAQINPIIVRIRGVDEEMAKRQHYLRSDEVIAFLNKIGESLEGYARPIDVASHQMNKSRLKLLYPALSSPDFTLHINEAITKHREISFAEATRKRYLLPSEVLTFLELIGEVVSGPATDKM